MTVFHRLMLGLRVLEGEGLYEDLCVHKQEYVLHGTYVS